MWLQVKGFFFITLQLPGENVTVPVSLSLFAQPACVNHIHHGLTGCHSVSLLTGNPSCDASACGPAIRHDKYSEPGQNTLKHRYMQKKAGILSSSTSVCMCEIDRVLAPHLYIVCVCMYVCVNAWMYTCVCVSVCTSYGRTICPMPVCNPGPAWQRTRVFLLFPPDPEGSTVTELSQHEVIQKISAGTPAGTNHAYNHNKNKQISY